MLSQELKTLSVSSCSDRIFSLTEERYRSLSDWCWTPFYEQGREKATRPQQVMHYLVLMTYVHIDIFCPGNSAPHLTISYQRYLAKCFKYLSELTYPKV